MWARNVEAMLAVWLAMSPFVFGVSGDERSVWAADFIAAVLILVFSLSCYFAPLRRAYVGTLLVGLILAIYGYMQPRPVPPWHQNHILVGLLLAMFAIVPSQASLPPEPWRAPPEPEPEPEPDRKEDRPTNTRAQELRS